MSAPFNRLFVDISYTRTQTGSVGVTRTVRSLMKEFQKSALPVAVPCRSVAVHSNGFRQVLEPDAAIGAGETFGAGGVVAGLLRWIKRSHIRRVALTVFPLFLQSAAWRLYSRRTFDVLSQEFPAVVFEPGDVIFMADASWHYDAVGAIQRARYQGARVVLMMHDLIPLRHPQYCAPLISMVFQEWLKRMLHNVDAVICNSHATMSDLNEYALAANCPLPPTGYFRLGCDPLRQPGAHPPRREVTEFFREPHASFAAVGSFEPRKNYAWLLQTFERLWAKGHDVRLLIAGHATADGQTLIGKMKRHPEQGHRLLTVFDASDQELEYVYGHSRALVFPSLAEGFGLPLVEARTRGCLVIASNLHVFQELADEGVSLYTQHSMEELQELVITHAAKGCRALVAPMPAFTWQDSVRQCLKIMEGLLAEQPRSRRPVVVGSAR